MSLCFMSPERAGIAARGVAGHTAWEWSATGSDVELFGTLVDYLTSTYCIDRDRIFSTGLSDGAFFTNALGCYRGDVLRAIAPVAGGPPSSSNSSPVACTGNVGAWIAQASNDDSVDFTQGGIATRDFWIARNGCSTPPAPVDATPSGCVEYQGCQSDLPVVFCVYTEGLATVGQLSGRRRSRQRRSPMAWGPGAPPSAPVAMAPGESGR